MLKRHGLFPLDGAIGPGEGDCGEPGTNKCKEAFNGDTFMVGQMVSSVLPEQSETAGTGEKQENQSGCLEPEGIERTAYGNYQRFSTGKGGVEKPVFLYNGLQRILDSGNFRHFDYCSPKIGVSFSKE
jgi:hypothetical protein